ncbi:hypothetical protein [Streptomyces sp. NBC_00258]|uniref:hypothetical protein n=1 Tax=Streptomyces sp. NBC_00258 TaxID=2903642 RepID=UPI002E28F358|nr:hypothetical protein [Streptomyces sp. NBC_00258]
MRSKRRVGVLLASAAAMVAALAGPVHSAVAFPATPTAASATEPSSEPSQAQWKQLGKAADAHSALGVFGDSDPVLTLPADTSAGEKTKVEAAIPSGMNVAVKTSKFTREKLEKIQKTVTARKWHSDADTYSVGVQYDGRKDKVVVDTDAPASATESLRNAYPGAIEVRSARFEPQAGIRFNSWSPFYGGIALISPGKGGCTAGFAVRSRLSGNEYMLTAAHCYDTSAQVYNRRTDWSNGQWVGTVVARWTTFDTETLLGPVYDSYIHTGGYDTSSQTHFVHGTAWVASNLKVCVSGAATYNHCGHPISNTSYSVCWSGTTVCISDGRGFLYDRGGTNWPSYNNGNRTEVGDSGAPIYTTDQTNSAAWIVGMHAGIVWSDCCTPHMVGVNWNKISSTTDLSLMTR